MSSPSVHELSNTNGSMAVISAAKGSYMLNNTSVYSTSPVKAIMVLQDTVFKSLLHVGSGSDVRTTYIAAPATAVKAGAMITPIEGNFFTDISLFSGSVALVL